jgi:hypothetical protein
MRILSSGELRRRDKVSFREAEVRDETSRFRRTDSALLRKQRVLGLMHQSKRPMTTSSISFGFLTIRIEEGGRKMGSKNRVEEGR